MSGHPGELVFAVIFPVLGAVLGGCMGAWLERSYSGSKRAAAVGLIGGVLVGGASLQGESFRRIAMAGLGG